MSVISERTRDGVNMTQAERSSRGDMIERLYKEGQSLADIAPQVGRTRERVRQILLSRGVTLRPQGKAQEK